MNLNQVTIPSLDIEQAITFYSQLGLRLIVHAPKRYARFECIEGDATFSIHKVDKIQDGERTTVYFEVEDVDKKVEELQNLHLHGNATNFDLLPTDQTWLWREARLKDPDGNPVILYHAGDNRKNPPWRIENDISAKAEIKEDNIEIERKYLVISDAFKNQSPKQYIIKQAYLNTDPERTVRVRIKGNKGYLTIKGKSNEAGTTRVEVEEEISLEKAESLLTLCLPVLIEKTRYEVEYKNHLWEVDVFEGAHEGLILAEIELTTESESFALPDWLGEEVTGNPKYYNSYLSEHPFKNL